MGRTYQHNPFTTPADQAAGAKIFSAHCAPCHGAGGQGGLGPNLASGAFFHGGTDADLYSTITEGIAGTAMPGTFFDGTQVWQVVAYLRTLGGSGGDVPRGDARHGEALFREKGCAGCHLVRGEGGIQEPDLSFLGSRSSVGYIRESSRLAGLIPADPLRAVCRNWEPERTELSGMLIPQTKTLC